MVQFVPLCMPGYVGCTQTSVYDEMFALEDGASSSVSVNTSTDTSTISTGIDTSIVGGNVGGNVALTPV